MDTQAPESPRIGVFNMPMVVKGEGKVNTDPTPAKLEIANGSSVEFTPPPATPPVATESSPDALDWPTYIAWRKTKCRPFDYVDGPRLATTIGEAIWLDPQTATVGRRRGLEEIDQATHELVGECAEVAELFAENGLNTFMEHRLKLIDEIGDVIFCGCWAMDAWGGNELATRETLDLPEPPWHDDLTANAAVIEANPADRLLHHRDFNATVESSAMPILVSMMMFAGLTSNSFKKLRFQRREQNVAEQCSRVFAAMTIAASLLAVVGATVEDAIRSNMRKLDARYPDGDVAGQGGGIRTGEGK